MAPQTENRRLGVEQRRVLKKLLTERYAELIQEKREKDST